MFVFTLLVIGLLLLAFKSTRLTGVAGLTLLSLVHPLLLLVLLAIGSILYFIYFKTNLLTRSRHELSKLFNRRD